MNATTKRELIICLLGLLAGLMMIMTQPYWISQSRNLRRIDRWITEVQGAVDQYKTDIPIKFLDVGHWTGDDGLVWIHASVDSNDAEEKLKKFINTLQPPRPIKWDIKNYDGLLKDLEVMEKTSTRTTPSGYSGHDRNPANTDSRPSAPTPILNH